MPERIPQYVPGGRTLDVGCGNGAFLSYLISLGWEASGTELSAEAADQATHLTGADVLVGELADLSLEEGSFDVVFMNHCLEHFVDFRSALQRARELLRPSGLLFVETPNIDGTHARREGSYWLHLDAPRHLQLFSARTLTRALESVGFDVVRTGTKDFREPRQWAATFRAEQRLGHALPDRPLRGPAVLDAVRAVADRLRLAARPLSGEIVWCWARPRSRA